MPSPPKLRRKSLPLSTGTALSPPAPAAGETTSERPSFSRSHFFDYAPSFFDDCADDLRHSLRLAAVPEALRLGPLDLNGIAPWNASPPSSSSSSSSNNNNNNAYNKSPYDLPSRASFLRPRGRSKSFEASFSSSAPSSSSLSSGMSGMAIEIEDEQHREDRAPPAARDFPLLPSPPTGDSGGRKRAARTVSPPSFDADDEAAAADPPTKRRLRFSPLVAEHGSLQEKK